jgi:hypothetical protein
MKKIELTNKIIYSPFSKNTCPNCNKKYVKILIVPWENEEPKVDIHVFCDSCAFKYTITKHSSETEEE